MSVSDHILNRHISALVKVLQLLHMCVACAFLHFIELQYIFLASALTFDWGFIDGDLTE